MTKEDKRLILSCFANGFEWKGQQVEIETLAGKETYSTERMNELAEMLSNALDKYEAEKDTFTATFTLTDEQMEAWKKIVCGDEVTYSAMELARKTIEECLPEYKEAREKQIPKPVKENSNGYIIGRCPSCNEPISERTTYRWDVGKVNESYCPMCGQKILWEDE